jgi:large subunit ribosomal protein L13
MNKLIVDGDGAIFGRMASFVAKELLKGDSVDILNSEKVIISGDKRVFAKKILARREMGGGGSLKGPKYIRKEDRLLKRMIRGMLPRDRAKGREAFKRLKCHIGNGDFNEADLKNVKTFDHKKLRKYATIKEIMGLIK